MSLPCPACSKELSRYRADLSTLEIDRCFYCQGFWFDHDELRRFFTSPKLYNRFKLPEYKSRRRLKRVKDTRICPVCPDNTALIKLAVGGLEVDECRECMGIWLDSGEIDRLVEPYQKGQVKWLSETAQQIRKGHFDQGALGQISRMIVLAFRTLIGRGK